MDSDNIGGCFLTFLVSLGFIILACGLGLLFAFPEMWLWNYIVPKIFNGPVIEYWDMVCLHALAVLLIPHSSSTTTKN